MGYNCKGEHGKAAVEDSDDEAVLSDDGEEDDPALHLVKVAHHGGVNRVRAMPQQPALIATWGDTALVQVRLEPCRATSACARERQRYRSYMRVIFHRGLESSMLVVHDFAVPD